MFSKVMPPTDLFRRRCRYICQDGSRSEVLKAEGVRGHHYELMAADFESQRQRRPEKSKPVFHCILSFYRNEKPGDAKMAEIAKKYLEEIGLGHTQYVIAKHTDTDHLHLHIIANRVGNDGRAINTGWERLRSERAAQKLTIEYNLVQTSRKDLAHTNLEAMNASDARRYKLYMAIREALPKCASWGDLEKSLLRQGIGMRFRYDKQTGARQGVSFRIEQECFRGSRVDPEFSCGKLEQTLAQQQKQLQQQRLTRRILEESQQTQRRSHDRGLGF